MLDDFKSVSIIGSVCANMTRDLTSHNGIIRGIQNDSTTTYEIWCYDEDMVVQGSCYDQTGTRSDNDGFDLDQTNVIFTPNGTGGFDVSTDAAPPPPDPEPMAGEVLGKYGGCTVGIADGTIDPTLPLLVLLSFVAILTRRKREA